MANGLNVSRAGEMHKINIDLLFINKHEKDQRDWIVVIKALVMAHSES